MNIMNDESIQDKKLLRPISEVGRIQSWQSWQKTVKNVCEFLWGSFLNTDTS